METFIKILIKFKNTMMSCISKNKKMKKSLEMINKSKIKNKKIKMKMKKSISNSFHAKSHRIHYQQLINLANYLLKFDMTLIS